MHPVLVDFGFYQLPTYGVLLAMAVVLGMWSLKRRADRRGLDGSRMVDFGMWVIIWALIGAKVLLVIVEWDRYFDDPTELIWVVRAGGVFLGGFIAALIAAAVLLVRHDLPALPTMDVAMPSLALGHAIGRLGCLAAGCCWGKECDLPWAVTYTDPVANLTVSTPLDVSMHPFALYSAGFNLVLYVLLAWLYRRKPSDGWVFVTYLLTYGIGRFALEWTRGDDGRGGVLGGLLSTSQVISLVMVLGGIGFLLWLKFRRQPQPEQ